MIVFLGSFVAALFVIARTIAHSGAPRGRAKLGRLVERCGTDRRADIRSALKPRGERLHIVLVDRDGREVG